jgi:L-lactate utilization protein LutB
MNSNIQAHYDVLGETIVAALRANRFQAEYFSTAELAKQHLLDMIPQGSKVGFGGSVTVKELDLHESLKAKGCIIFDHHLASDPKEKDEICRQELVSDVFLTGTNAITRDGKLYNVDGKGNRVAAMIYGPRQVIVVAGINKVVKDLAQAEERVKQHAAPINCLRVNAPNPCTKTGYCLDCDSPRRICNAAVTLHKQPYGNQITVLLIGEELGF